MHGGFQKALWRTEFSCQWNELIGDSMATEVRCVGTFVREKVGSFLSARHSASDLHRPYREQR